MKCTSCSAGASTPPAPPCPCGAARPAAAPGRWCPWRPRPGAGTGGAATPPGGGQASSGGKTVGLGAKVRRRATGARCDAAGMQAGRMASASSPVSLTSSGAMCRATTSIASCLKALAAAGAHGAAAVHATGGGQASQLAGCSPNPASATAGQLQANAKTPPPPTRELVHVSHPRLQLQRLRRLAVHQQLLRRGGGRGRNRSARAMPCHARHLLAGLRPRGHAAPAPPSLQHPAALKRPCKAPLNKNSPRRTWPTPCPCCPARPPGPSAAPACPP